MNYLTGSTLKELREKRNMTQAELAERLSVTDKAISKWENGRGMPDISILPELAKELETSIAELLSNSVVTNTNRPANIKKMHFYVCPICGNVIQSVGEGAYSCHGILLPEAEPEEMDSEHEMNLEIVDHEYYLSATHSMEKNHYISFLAYVTSDQIQMKKLYPEQLCDCRFRKCGPGFIYAYCNRHGLYVQRVPSSRKK